jgi:aminoglycoside phosphotransferase (APT) family kinase protein
VSAATAGSAEGAAARELDVDRLAGWLDEHVAGFRCPLQVERFAGGQSNPTYRLSSPSGRYVMRKKPDGELLPSAHAVDREYRVMTALRDTPVPVPATFGYSADASVIGTPFFVMDCVEGRIFWDPALPELSPAERGALWDDVNRVVAALHRVDVGAVGLADYGRPGNYFERQIARWTRQYRASTTQPIEAMERLIDWLPAHVPGGDETTLVHGDLRLDNMIVHPTEPRVVALLDWELSTLGHPLADLSYHVITWRLTAAQFRGMAGKDLAALGIPAEADYVARYCARTGRAPIDRAEWEFHVAFSMFRLAAILQGIARRAEDGTAASTQALETGRKARPIAEAAWAQVRALESTGRAGAVH